MQSMAERKGGNYYFVQDIKKVDECFVDCLGMVTTMLATKGKITVKLLPTPAYPEIRVVNTFGTYLKKNSDTEAIIDIPTIYAGMRKDFVFDVEFEPTKQSAIQAAELGLIQLDFEFFEIGASTPIKLSKTIKVKFLPSASSESVLRNLDVRKNYLRVKTADVMDKVEELQIQPKFQVRINNNWWLQTKRNHKEALAILKKLEEQLSADLELQQDSLIISLKTQVAQILKMVHNDSVGVANEFKTQNYVAQQRNVYMNQQSAPQFAQEMYANSQQAANFKMARSRKS